MKLGISCGIGRFRKHGQAGASANLADFWSNGEIGDWWRFDNVATSPGTLTADINNATGMALGRLISSGVTNPTLEQDGSGRYVARFNAAGDCMIYALGGNISQPGTMILCVNDTNTSSHTIATGSSDTLRWQVSTSSGNVVIWYAGTQISSSLAENFGTKVLTAVFNGASSFFRVNGVQTATGNIGAQLTNQFRIGASYNGSGGMNGDIYSALFINRVLTEDELDRAEELLGSHADLDIGN